MDIERRYGIIAEMTGQTVERVRASVAKYLEIPLERVQPESNLAELGLDSLGALELIFELEEEFQITVPNDRAKEFTTVRAVCDGIELLQKSPAPEP